jgi:hypothetical protein
MEVEMNLFRKLMVFFVVVLILSLLGCATNRRAPEELNLNAKKMTPPEGQALVYFLRPTNYGGGQGMMLMINQKPIGKTYGGLFLYRVLDPGKYIFTSKAENTSELALNVLADKTYYLEQQVKMGFFSGRANLVLLDNVEGKEKLMKSSLALPNLQ